jgi:hypothetical protein
MGSCGTSPISRPRSVDSRAGVGAVMSSPLNSIRPPVMRPEPGSRPSTAAAVVDLPEPDSPTMATRSPGWIVNESPCSTGRSSPPVR